MSRLGHGLQIRQLKPGRTTIRIARPLETVIGDGRLIRSAINPQAPQQAPPQEKNVRLGDCIQIMSQPADKTAEAMKKNELTTGTDRGRLAAAATGPVCRAM